MPAFNNYNNVQGNFSEGFKQLEPGAYVVRVQAVRTEWTERDYQSGLDRDCSTRNDAAVMLVFDIADGEFAGEYSKEYFCNADGTPKPEQDWRHQFKLYWGDLNNTKDAERTRYMLDCFTASNPGFDALAAFEADKWPLFVGKLFGVVLNGTVRTNERGYDQWNLRTSTKPYTVDDIRNGNNAEPRITDKRTQVAAQPSTTAATAAAPSYYDDIPFN